MLFSIETHITCDFPGGSRPPITPLDPHMKLEIRSPENANKITDVRALYMYYISFYIELLLLLYMMEKYACGEIISQTHS